MASYYQVHMETGAIVDERSCILYDAESIKDLSLVAKVRLAQLHSTLPDLEWEGQGRRKGAWDYLIEEGLMPAQEAPAVFTPTPTPWWADHSGERIAVYGSDGKRLFLGACSERGIGRRVAEANAALIVRAVNTHADLLAALEALVSQIPTPNLDDPALDAAVEQANAAIAKARGTES